jgi:hypothetical protein
MPDLYNKENEEIEYIHPKASKKGANSKSQHEQVT